ncbi:hypothetical protein BASA81_000493 [Batrachochytrium salamandrivorans]|nr:hypothetical protein BASA81_000493 [Batrachochytrium salamandrivorans]
MGEAWSMVPLVLIHGISNTPECWHTFAQTVREDNPDQLVLALRSPFSGVGSFVTLGVQVKWFQHELEQLSIEHGRLDLVCHSQGAVICQAVLVESNKVKVSRFVSLAGPQMGVYGALWFRFLPPAFAKFSLEAMSKLAYESWAQDTLSVANLWNDPHSPDVFAARNTFLPRYLGLLQLNTTMQMKQNYLKLERAAYLVGSFVNRTHDEGIDPWQSGVFGYYQAGSQAAAAAMALVIQSHPNIRHDDWLFDAEVIRRFVLPQLNRKKQPKAAIT